MRTVSMVFYFYSLLKLLINSIKLVQVVNELYQFKEQIVQEG